MSGDHRGLLALGQAGGELLVQLLELCDEVGGVGAVVLGVVGVGLGELLGVASATAA
jgi:hypothetical protein